MWRIWPRGDLGFYHSDLFDSTPFILAAMIIAHRKLGKSATVQEARGSSTRQEVDLVCVFATEYQKCRQTPTGSGDRWVIDVFSLAAGVEPAESNAGALSPYVGVYALCLFACDNAAVVKKSPTACCSRFPASSLHQSASSPSFKTPQIPKLIHCVLSGFFFFSSWLLRFLSGLCGVTPAAIDILSVCVCYCFSVSPSIFNAPPPPSSSWFCATDRHSFDPPRRLPRRVTAVIRAERLWDAHCRPPAGAACNWEARKSKSLK